MYKKLYLQTNNSRIVRFYEDNPSISFDAANIMLIDIFEKFLLDVSSNVQNTTISAASTEQFIEIFDKSSSIRSALDATTVRDKNRLESVLNKVYGTAEIMETTSGSGNAAAIVPGILTMKRDKKPVILFENKEYDRNVNSEEVKQFIHTLEQQHCHGIFLSQYMGITSKPNYHIETHSGKLLIYVHNVEYSVEKIRIAVDIIDNLSVKLAELNVTTKDCSISSEILDEINREYQTFVSQKESIIETMKESNKRILHQLDDLKFACLDKYLSTKYTSAQKKGYKCELCKIFMASSLKAMAAHRRGCNRKNAPKIVENIVLTAAPIILH